jgi:gamma-glutamyltranspeptidase/glutathione hydrolase
MFRNPDLASVLERIAQSGPDGFYRGATARAIVEQMRHDHGLMTHADLAGYVAKWREPLQFKYRGMTITSMPPPSSGGVTLAMIGHILEHFDLRQLGLGTPAALHVTFEAMRRAFAARNAKLGDPDFVSMPLAELLGSSWADAQSATIDSGRATPSREIQTASETQSSGLHTTHFSIVDAEGNAVALTTTLNWWYGSGITVAGAGFLLNNEMDDFAAIPGTPNAYGLVQGEPNAIAPKKRMLSSMSPTIVAGPDGQLRLVAGAAGGPTIITSVFQEISNVLDFGLDTRRAVLAPRYHMQHLPDVVAYESGGMLDTTRQQLEAMGHTFEPRPHIADAPLIGREGNEWVGVSEPRRAGALAAAP